MNLEDILAVFALSEEEQERYFPRWERAVWVHEGLWETSTQFARLPALMVLAEMTNRDRADPRPAQLCAEIDGLAVAPEPK